jgi:acyl carrier protein
MEVLKVDRVEIHDDFFDLGGDSLLLIQAMSRISEKFGVQLSLEILFNRSTLADLGSALAGLENQDRLAHAVAVQPN